MAVVACRVDRQIDAILHLNHPRARVHRARVLHLPDRVLHVQVLHVHLVRIAMAHLQVVAPQVVVTLPIAAHTQVVARRVDRQIDAMVLVILHAVTHRVQVHVLHLIVAIAVTVRATRVQVQIVQQAVHMVTATHVRRPVHLQIVPIAHHAHTVIVIRALHQAVVHRVIVQQVVHTETATHDQVHVQVLIAANVVTVHVIHVQLQIVPIVVQVLIVQPVVHMVTAIHAQAHAQLQIVHEETTHSVAIGRKQAMTDVARRVDRQIDAMALRLVVTQIVLTGLLDHHAMIAAVRVTANAVVVPIVPEVASPMIAKNVHAVALAKSA